MIDIYNVLNSSIENIDFHCCQCCKVTTWKHVENAVQKVYQCTNCYAKCAIGFYQNFDMSEDKSVCFSFSKLHSYYFQSHFGLNGEIMYVSLNIHHPSLFKNLLLNGDYLMDFFNLDNLSNIINVAKDQLILQ